MGRPLDRHGSRGAEAHPWVKALLLPIAILAAYFAAPLDSELAPIGVLLGALVSVATLAAVVLVVAAEARGARRLTGWHLIIALEVALVVFALAYYVIASRSPEQFNGLTTRIDALYFSTATAATVGYGDVHATGQAARALVTAHMIFNIVFIAAVINLARDRISERRAAMSGRHSPPTNGSWVTRPPAD